MRKGKIGRAFGYQHKAFFHDGQTRYVARFQCRDCPETLDIPIASHSSPGGRSPEWVTQRAHKLGWQADTTNANVARCPGCIEQGKRNFMEPDRQKPLPLPPVMVRPHMLRVGISPPDLGIKEVSIVPTTAKPASATNVTALDPERRYKELTYVQKAAIRTQIEGTFDEKSGLYSDGVSDQSIGEQLQLPWAVVKYVRERDYGMLRVPPELAPLEQRFAYLQGEYQKVLSEFKPLATRMEQLASDLADVKNTIAGFKSKYAA